MPSVILERLPLPSLTTYTSISVFLLSCSIYFAVQVPRDEFYRLYGTMLEGENGTVGLLKTLHDGIGRLLLWGYVNERMHRVLSYMLHEPLCIWTMINMAYCSVLLMGKCIQKFVFGKLRVVEKQHLKDKFWNFLFYKFIFIFGVMNVHYMEEVVLWCSWFSLIGVLTLSSQLCKDRFEYLSFSPTISKWTHMRLFSLMLSILCVAIGVGVVVGFYASLNTFLFMAAECVLVTLRILYVITRYVLYLYDANYNGIWENKGTWSYYCELFFELSILTVDFFHHLHMLLWGNIFLSMASLVICMQLRFLFNEIQRKYMRHKNYLKVAKHIKANYPLATQEEIDSNTDDCAICWDRMDTARKLPCGHMFHLSCLRSWLEQVANCPTCRTPLINKNTPATSAQNVLGQEDVQARTPNSTTNHFFHFDGSRYVSWFPSFFVEVSHTSLLGDRHPTPVQMSQLDNMAHQVLQMFPHLNYSVILEDLRQTRSIEQTVENILEERLRPLPTVMFPRTPLVLSSAVGSLMGMANMNRTFFDIPRAEAPTASNRSSPQRNTDHNRPEETEIPSFSRAHSSQTAPIPEDFDDIDAHLGTQSGVEGSRFSKSSQERERMLAVRKEVLLNRCRSKYISKVDVGRKPGENSGSSSS